MNKLRLVIFAVLTAGFLFTAKAQVTVESVTFNSQGEQITGNLFFPEDYEEGDVLPGIIFVTPATGVKEQVSGVYAEELAERGFITLAYDARGYGESEGVRSKEDVFLKSEDIRSAISYMCLRSEVDADNVGATAICAGSPVLISTAVAERRIKAVATISGALSLRGVIIAYGGDEALLAASAARQYYDETGEVMYMPAFVEPGPDASQFDLEAYDYYVGNQAQYPTWENQIDAGFIVNLAIYDIPHIVSFLSPTPVLFIAGTEALTGPLSQLTYDSAQEPKEIYWVEGASHIGMYHIENYVNEASDKLEIYFKDNLNYPTSLEEINENNFNVFPNPTSENVTINISNISDKSFNIFIYNEIGQKIFELNKELANSENQIIWNRTDQAGNSVPNGIYFIEISTENQKIMKKVVLTQK